jgi:AraC-like DNA-binding protein
MEVIRANKLITIEFIPDLSASQAYPEAFRQMIELFMVFTIHELDGLIFEKTAPAKISFPLNDAVDIKEYERVLRCRPKHVPDAYSMAFKDQFWDEAIITANHELQRLLLEMANSHAVKPQQAPLLSERIVNYLTANAYLGVVSLEEIAANFNTSARTLQRKLQEEGVSFQQLADSVRKTIALQYLQSGDYPLKEVSYILGYNELSAFTRAFKRWTGTTPVDYQKRRG